ncbi:hypothetical protein C8Q74DRAFT_1365750 [Fomes fomentarius]|nr:hypothetical protein C8Q74DRAFT_1365750 [Fomes fomentarius]
MQFTLIFTAISFIALVTALPVAQYPGGPIDPPSATPSGAAGLIGGSIIDKPGVNDGAVVGSVLGGNVADPTVNIGGA